MNDLIFLIKDSPDNEEILSEISNLKEKWEVFVGRDEYCRISQELESEVAFARDPKNKEKIFNKNNGIASKSSEIQTPSVSQPKSGFKKIKIIEEEINEKTEEKLNKETTSRNIEEKKLDETRTSTSVNSQLGKFKLKNRCYV